MSISLVTHRLLPNPSPATPTHTSTIVGSAIGVVVLVTIFATWFLYRCCRRRRTTKEKSRECRIIVSRHGTVYWHAHPGAVIHPFTASTRRTSLFASSEPPSPSKESSFAAELTSSVGAVIGKSRTAVDETTADIYTSFARESFSRFASPAHLRTTEDSQSKSAPTPDGRALRSDKPTRFPGHSESTSRAPNGHRTGSC